MTGRAEVLRLHDDDNVVVATCNIGSGASFDSVAYGNGQRPAQAALVVRRVMTD
ncbi:MAG: hypothetical protein ACREQ1_11365 [Woeseiaceae bacterium]